MCGNVALAQQPLSHFSDEVGYKVVPQKVPAFDLPAAIRGQLSNAYLFLPRAGYKEFILGPLG
jgi:hypothetical protein